MNQLLFRMDKVIIFYVFLSICSPFFCYARSGWKSLKFVTYDTVLIVDIQPEMVIEATQQGVEIIWDDTKLFFDADCFDFFCPAEKLPLGIKDIINAPDQIIMERAGDNLIFKCEHHSGILSVFSANGEMIKRIPFKEDHLIYDLSSLSHGIYIFKIDQFSIKIIR